MKEAPHAELGLLHGFTRCQNRRGLCEVRGVRPNQWVAAAKGLGFHAHVVRFKDRKFERVLQLSDPSPCTLKWGHCRVRNCHPNLAAVFLDRISLSVRDDGYWNLWLVPHVFFLEPDPALLAPEGWEERAHMFNHRTLGGSTTPR